MHVLMDEIYARMNLRLAEKNQNCPLHVISGALVAMDNDKMRNISGVSWKFHHQEHNIIDF